MTPAKLAALIRYKTGTNSTTFTDAEMLPLINTFKDEIASRIVGKNAGFFLVPSTFNLVANQREYRFADDHLNRMHKLEIKFSSSDARQPSSYIKDYLGSETESEIVKYFSNAQGEFAHTIRRRAVFILSGTIISVTDGGRIWYYAYPEDLTDLTSTTEWSTDPSTTTFGFPRQFHEIIARLVSIEYKGKQPKPISLSAKEKNVEIDLKEQLEAISIVDNSGEVIGENLSDKETGNNGFNY